jgi:hypothetical protein
MSCVSRSFIRCGVVLAHAVNREQKQIVAVQKCYVGLKLT